MDYGQRLGKIRSLLYELALDAAIIYNAEGEDPSILPWVLGDDIADTACLLVKKRSCHLFFPQWSLCDFTSASYKIPLNLVGTAEKSTMAREIAKYLSNVGKIGFAGNLPYREVVSLGNFRWIDLEENLKKVYAIKSEEEIGLLKKIRRRTVRLLEDMDCREWAGKTEIELSENIRRTVGAEKYSIGHLDIVAGEKRGREATCGNPSRYRIGGDDAVCIDVGLRRGTYYSDLTRCYFLGGAASKYGRDYLAFKKIVSDVSSEIRGGQRTDRIKKIFRGKFDSLGLVGSFVPEDLGHGIGTGKHEYPEIGFDPCKWELESGMVFTLEPEFRTKSGILLRYEDMFFIDSKGRCVLL